MAHPVEDSEDYLLNPELSYARLLSGFYESTVITMDDQLMVVARYTGLTLEEVKDVLTRAQRTWSRACEVAEADNMLEGIRFSMGKGDTANALFNFEALDRHLSNGKRPPSEWTGKGQVDEHNKG